MSSALTTVADIQRFATACTRYANETSNYNFRIEFHEEDPHNEFLKEIGHPSAKEDEPKYYTYRDGDNIVIHVPNPTTAMSERDAKVIKGGILHEILHTTEGTLDAKQEISDSGIGKLQQRDKLAHIFNSVEDHRIERVDCEKFEGDRYVIRDLYSILSSEFVDKMKGTDTSKFKDDTKKLLGLRLADLVARDAWLNIGEVVEEQYDVYPEEAMDTAATLIDKGYDERLRQIETVSDSIQLAKDLFNELFEDEDAQQHIEQNAQQEGQEKGEQQDGEGEEQQGKGQGDDESDEGEGAEASGEGSTDDGEEKGKIPPDDFDYLDYLMKHKAIPDSGSEPPESGKHLDYTKYLDSADKFPDFDPCPLDNIGIANFGANFFKNTNNVNVERLVRRPTDGAGGLNQLNSVFSNHGIQANSLASKIRRLLQVQSQARYVGGATKGRIHRKRAFRAALPTVGDGRWNREIFKRRHQDATLDVAVSILCDFSGSMGGPKMAHAAFGGFILSDAISRVLHIPVQVQTFSEYSLDTVICVLKNWNETVNEESYKERAARAVRTMQQNDDGSAILWAYSDLQRRPEKRKVMVVLSDGSPASSRPGDAMKYTRDLVRDIEEEGKVEMYGIGIMDRNVKHIYSENETINKPDEIEGAILNTVKRKLIV